MKRVILLSLVLLNGCSLNSNSNRVEDISVSNDEYEESIVTYTDDNPIKLGLFLYDNNYHNKEVIKREYILRCLNGQAKCEICGISDWNNQPIVFQIHHIDGDNKNNEKENLQLLCPNCHSQTDNFSNKKKE